MTDVRCPRCGALIARDEDGTLVIRRGPMQLALRGRIRGSMTCYGCTTLNVIRIDSIT
jgi:hypothetical protein